MAPSQKPLRYAHADGHTDLCYSDDGRHMITCGSDGDARIWAGFEDDDPFSTVVGEKAFAVAFWGDRFYIGNDNNHVQAYSFQGKSRDGIVTRFTAPVTHIAVSRKGDTIVSGSCDMTIHVTDKETLKDRIFSGHKAPILGVAIDPKEKYLASSSCDGSVKIWSLLDGKDLKTWGNIIEPTNDFSFAKALGRAAWTPETGSYLAIPSGKSTGSGDRLHFQVILAERGTWNTMITLSDEHIKKPLSIAAFSPCGGYLAASAIGGELIIWDINSTKTIVKETHESGLPMTAMVWNPSGNGELAFCDNQGQLGLFENCIPQSADYSKPDDIGAPVDNEKEENASVLDNLDTLSNMMDDDDEDDENVISLEKIKSEVGFGVSSTSKEPETASVADEEDDLDKNMPLISGLPNFTKLQKPFQPTSTPIHLQQRFMVWNSVGMVRCYNTEEENSIDVEFHDSSIHHPLHIPNYLKHTMAALTKEALLLACEMDDETPSKLVCVLMNSWDGSKEWNMDMPEGEEVVAVGAGAGWAAVATNSYSLRFFTIGGCQREVMSIPGQVVCLTGHEHFLVVVFHGGIGVDGDQHLFYQVVKVGSRSAGGAGLLAHPPQPLPLSQKSTLSWVGFTDEGSVATQDSLGVIRLLFTARSDKGSNSSSAGSWVPVCKTNSNLKNKYDHYFVLGVSEKYQNVRCVLCKGSHYPQTTPRPSVVEIPMQMPLCEAQTEKSLHEEKFWRAQLFSKNIEMISKVDESYMFEKDDLERTLKETVMKLFALACRGDLDFRAVELCKMMPSSQVVMLAEKYASKLGKQHLADRINTVVNQKVEEEEMQTRMAFHDSEERNGYNGHRGLNSPLLFNTDDGANDYPGTPVEFTNTPASSGEAENILLSAKQRFSKLSNIVIKPSIKPEQNPFKKTPTSSNAKEKGLSRFSTPPMVNAKTSKQNGTPDSVAQLPKVKQTKLSGGKVDKPVAEKQEKTEKGAKKKMTYIQWFNKEKDGLVDEFPDLSVAELTKVAMKRFKEWQAEMKKEESKCATDAESSEVTNGAAKTNGSTKDDADNEDADKMTKSIPETEMSESVTEGESESMAVDENAEMADEESSESMTSTIKPQTKRKTAGDKFSNPEAKKAKNAGNASSKLSAFMFKKS
ncbi:WD repeat and HMG-box DNA-binding protein 1 [Ischnura elegans]|uniref:WD repeat and HMG-box DNA-binding protein 1 n=1 Tax=Ischnura elegans TaxID=197161 RepID=UPI001ED8B320|nr:WD repeat and HMG-box DNA-binding protein 1 [Ischnura elegans]